MTADTNSGAPSPATLLAILSSTSTPTATLYDPLQKWNDDIEATNFGLASLVGDGGSAAEL